MDTLSWFMWYSTIGCCFLIIIVGFDDLVFDCFHWGYKLYKIAKGRIHHYQPLTLEKLNGEKEKRIAIMVACWQESDIIAQMLLHNLETIAYMNYYIFVGVYPNDLETINAVKKVSDEHPHVQCIIGDDPGPTNKASNLNYVFKGIEKFEQEHNFQFDIFVMHDSEDVIHPLSLKAYNYMIPKKDMVQLPVFPLTVNLFNFVHWIYNDEFIENHLNYMLVREVIGGHVPSAGVGTALSRNAIMTLNQNNNGIFPVSTHTEDYSLSLQIHRLNLSAIFMTQTIEKVVLKKRFWFFGKQVYRTVSEHVVTRSLFPTTYWAAVRQRSRWTYGISLQEWQNSHWRGKLITKLTLFRDRKGLISNFIAGYGYLVFLYWAIIWAFHFQYPTLIRLTFFTEKKSWFSHLLFITAIFMFNRILQRAIATSRIYGILPGLISIPRAIVGNIINLHSTYYSLKMFFGGVIKKKTTAWNKTKNVFPTSEQLGYQRHRLGDWLVHKGALSIENLKQALKIQQRTHEKIGVILLKNRWITKNDLIHTLTEHGLTHEINWLDHRVLTPDEISHLSRQDYLSLIQAQILPISSTPYSMHFVVNSSLTSEVKLALRKKYYPLKIYFSIVDHHIIRLLGYRFYLWI